MSTNLHAALSRQGPAHREPIPPKSVPQLSNQKKRLYGGYGDIIAWNDTPDPPSKSENVRVQACALAAIAWREPRRKTLA